MGWLPIITFGIAAIGAVLGIINTWQSISRSRLKLRVRPLQFHRFSGGHTLSDHADFGGLAVEVVNLSEFAVTITDVGLVTEDKRTIIDMDASKDLPKRLQSREALTLYYSSDTYRNEACANVVNAFANTACGTKVCGSGKALDHYIKGARKYQAAELLIEKGPPSHG